MDAAVAAARRRGQSLWLVGGALRDCAAGTSLRDVDLSVDGDAVDVEVPRWHIARTRFPGWPWTVALDARFVRSRWDQEWV